MVGAGDTGQRQDMVWATGPGPALRVRVLGGFGVTVGARLIEDGDWPLPEARALVKFLALAPGQRRTVAEVLAALWPAAETEEARGHLDRALPVARQALDRDERGAPMHPSLLRLTDDSLALDAPGGVMVDRAAFELAAGVARGTGTPADYRAAIAQYGGELLPADPNEAWVDQPREHLRATYLALYAELAESLHARGDRAAADVWQQLVALDRTHEGAHLALMRHYANLGQRPPALRQYARLREALQRDLGVEPSPESQRLYAAILSGQVGTARPTLRMDALTPAAPTLPTNLPDPLTTFIGRRRELAELAPLLAPATAPSRLVTLAGPGGSGKTRLALEAARQLPTHHRDGIWLVELAGLSDPERVPDAVARVLRVREEPGIPLTTTLRAALAPKVLLVILDNCEHLIDACAALAGALLRACSHLYLLATSREALHVPGELVWRVPTLALPAVADSTEPSALAQSDAVQLLLDRVQLRDPAFALTSQNAGAIAAICRQLDGLPLALELVAGQVPTFTPEALVARLDDALALLVGGGDAAPSRQQTLRGTLDWSYALLDAAEATTFRRLAVFAGGWTLAAAEVVCADPATPDAPPPATILDLLAQLVDKSLVAVEHTGRATRYRLLEPVRQYAAEHLVASGEEETIRARHARFAASLVEAALERMGERDQGERLEALDRERDNLRGALHWCLRQRETDLGWRIGRILWRYWMMRGQLLEGRYWLLALLALADDQTAARADMLQGAGALHGMMGDHAASARYYGEAIASYRTLGDRNGLAGALNNQGLLHLRLRGDAEQASRCFTEALALNRETGNQHWEAINLNNLGIVAQQRGDLRGALALQEESLAILRDLGLDAVASMVLIDLGDALCALGEASRAEPVYRQSLDYQRAAGARLDQARAALSLGWLLLNRGDSAEARDYLLEALTVFRAIRVPQGLLSCLESIAALAAATDQPAAALRLIGAVATGHTRFNSRAQPAHRAGIERATTRARAALGDGAADAWEAGQLLTLEEATAEAFALVSGNREAESYPDAQAAQRA